MAEKKCPACIQKVAEYMLTYGDMITLLLCFFIMLYRTGKTDAKEMQIILSAFKSSTGFFEGGNTLTKGTLEEMGMNLESLPSQTKGRVLSKAAKTASEVFKTEIQAGKVRVFENERGLVISLVGADYFNPASAILLPPIKDTLKKAAGFLRDFDRFVRIEGHSDFDTMMPGNETGREERVYINNWDLAGARAINALIYLVNIGQIDPTLFQAVSFGSVRPMIVEEEGSPETKAFNRRIDLVILKDKRASRDKHDSDYKLPSSKLPNTETNFEGEN